MSYTPTEWESGEVITAEKLNNIERGVIKVEEEAMDKPYSKTYIENNLYTYTKTPSEIEEIDAQHHTIKFTLTQSEAGALLNALMQFYAEGGIKLKIQYYDDWDAEYYTRYTETYIHQAGGSDYGYGVTDSNTFVRVIYHSQIEEESSIIFSNVPITSNQLQGVTYTICQVNTQLAFNNTFTEALNNVIDTRLRYHNLIS